VHSTVESTRSKVIFVLTLLLINASLLSTLHSLFGSSWHAASPSRKHIDRLGKCKRKTKRKQQLFGREGASLCGSGRGGVFTVRVWCVCDDNKHRADKTIPSHVQGMRRVQRRQQIHSPQIRSSCPRELDQFMMQRRRADGG
jgi:hypothetical protein